MWPKVHKLGTEPEVIQNKKIWNIALALVCISLKEQQREASFGDVSGSKFDLELLHGMFSYPAKNWFLLSKHQHTHTISIPCLEYFYWQILSSDESSFVGLGPSSLLWFFYWYKAEDIWIPPPMNDNASTPLHWKLMAVWLLPSSGVSTNHFWPILLVLNQSLCQGDNGMPIWFLQHSRLWIQNIVTRGGQYKKTTGCFPFKPKAIKIPSIKGWTVVVQPF